MTPSLSRLSLSVFCILVLQPGFAQGFANDERTVYAQGKEDPSLRSQTAKHFLMPDGTMKAHISSGSLHYKDATGRWQDINCTLLPSSKEGYVAENTTNNIASYFPSDASNGVMISVPSGQIKTGVNPTLNVLAHDGNLRAVLHKAASTSAIIAGSTVTYTSLFANADNTYHIERDQVKNNLVLTSMPAGLPASGAYFAYSEQIQLPAGWDLHDNKGHGIHEAMTKGGLTIVNEQGETVFCIPVPDVFEENNPSVTIHADGLWEYTYKVKDLGAGLYELSTLVPVEWLTDQQRDYPVVIDPTVNLAGGYGGWQHDGFSYLDGNPTSFVFIGFNTNGATYNGYVRFDISSIPDNNIVTNTQFEAGLNGTGAAVTETVNINHVSGAYGPYGGYNSAVYTDLADGTYTSFPCTGTGSYGPFDLGNTADTHVNNNLGVNLFQLGLNIPGATTWKRFTSNACYLEVTYTPCIGSIDAQVSASNYNGVNISCNGGSDGSISTIVTGGNSYTYSWSGPNSFSSTDANPSGLIAGTYDLVVYAAGNPCPDSVSITLTGPDSIEISAISPANVSCNGGSDGSATASAIGGTGTKTYSWSTGGTGTSLSGVAAGTYTVTATDANGCTDTETVTITQPTAVVASTLLSANVSCNGGSDGAATASATGGTGTKTYTWSTGGTGAALSGVTAGTYTVTATDANGCTDTETVTITQPTAVVASTLLSANVSCNGGSDGAATASATGGTGTKTYTWSTGGTGTSLIGVTAGTYTVTATDANGCTDTETVTITQPTAVVTSVVSSTNVSCNGGSNGAATASATGGTGTKIYNWSTGGTGTSLSGLTAGTYTVTATDVNGCTDTETVTITQPSALAASASLDNNVTCNGGSNGAASASASGGTTPYSYLWSNSAGTAVITNLAAGTYTVTVTDNNGCTNTAFVTVTQPTALNVSVSTNNDVSCNGFADGGATASASGGIPPYSYLWPNGEITAMAVNLLAGTHIVTVTDDNGCIETSSVVISEPAALIVTGTTDSNASCNGSMDGGMTAFALGGTAPYVFIWSNSGTSASVTGVSAGTYTVTVTDNNGCTDTDTSTVGEPALLVAIIDSLQDVHCAGDSNGSAYASVSGGVLPYTFSWSNGSATSEATQLPEGEVFLTVTDDHGCEATASDTVTYLFALPVIDLGPDIDTNIGVVVVEAEDYFATYTWNTGADSATLVATQSGTYTLTVTDTNGCVNADSISISLWPAGITGPDQQTAVLVVYPNPNQGQFTVETHGFDGTQLQWSVYTLSGTLVHSGTLAPAATSVRGTIDLHEVAGGIYMLRISGGKASGTTKILIE